MNELYRVIGISKQAVAQYGKRQACFDEKVARLVIEADELRKAYPGCGVAKMYDILQPDFIGRDRFITTFMSLGYRLQRKKNYKRTTMAASIQYPNLIKGMQVSAPSVIWQSDITYIRVGVDYYYAVFILDVYTKKIVGYQVSDHMRATANLKTLQMALKGNKAPKIHHSDRGSQYIYKDYITLLKANNCQISMAGSAQDNAYAERIHRTIKNDYLAYWHIENFQQLKKYVRRAVQHYNMVRTHDGIGKISPFAFEQKWLNMDVQQRPVITIFNNEGILKTVNSI